MHTAHGVHYLNDYIKTNILICKCFKGLFNGFHLLTTTKRLKHNEMWTHNAPFRAIHQMLEELATATMGSTLSVCGHVGHVGCLRHDWHQMMLEILRHTSHRDKEVWQQTDTQADKSTYRKHRPRGPML